MPSGLSGPSLLGVIRGLCVLSFAFLLALSISCDNDEAANGLVSSETPGDANPDVCNLLTLSEVEAATGLEVKATENRDSIPFFECHWLSDSDNYLDVVLRQGVDRAAIENSEGEVVDNLGEYAKYHGGPLLKGLEVVASPDWYIAVSPVSYDGAIQDPREASISLAKIIIQRLND